MENFAASLTHREARQRAKARWDWWRLVLDAGMDFNTVFYQMLPSEVAEANAAYDLLIEAQKKVQKGR